MYMSRETFWKQELQAAKDLTLSEIHAFGAITKRLQVNWQRSLAIFVLLNTALEHVEHQYYTWREECRIPILRSRETESRYKGEDFVHEIRNDNSCGRDRYSSYTPF